MKLVIVESPTKARKLTQYLGKEYKVEASVGHVRDLPKKKLGVDLEKNFEPTYQVSPDKKKVIKQLQQEAKKADAIYLATDPDREGEAIAWHVQYLLEDGAKSKVPYYRATFHEITKTAVQEAIDHPGEIKQDLVDAQQARRVVDRLVGYQLSPVLWRKIRRGLSAGRVQSVALRMIVEREREIEAFKPEEYWEVDVALSTDLEKQTHAVVFDKEGKLSDELPADTFVAQVKEVASKKYEPKTETDVTPVIDDLKVATYQVKDVERKQRKRVSLPPFTTSTLQQAAATRLGMTSKQTMRLAQQLYEEGLITYHRTDSVNLSSQSIAMARDYINQRYGQEYLPSSPRVFRGKSKNAQEAHEAIRITDVALSSDDVRTKSSKFTERHVKLYDLIWRRFVSSQMKEALYDQTAITIAATADKNIYTLRASGSVLKFDGWMRLFPSRSDTLLPEVSSKQNLAFVQENALQKFTQPPPRYNDASLVKELEKRGIGRPSTYASIISVIVDRGYVDRIDKRFIATPIGTTVSDFLLKHFPQIMDYDFTAEMEEDLDRISQGKKEWKKVVKDFYQPLDKTIEKVKDDADRVQIPVEKTGEKCPTCGESDGGEVVIRTGRFGKFKSCSRFPDCKYTENIVENLGDQQCPLCQKGDVIIKNSRWGKSFFGCSRYPECDWASWQKPEPGLKLTKAEWEKMQAERKARAAKRKKRPTKSKTTKRKKRITKK